MSVVFFATKSTVSIIQVGEINNRIIKVSLMKEKRVVKLRNLYLKLYSAPSNLTGKMPINQPMFKKILSGEKKLSVLPAPITFML